MNSILATHALPAPHLLPTARLSPSRTFLNPSANMSGRKRKADDDAGNTDGDLRMSRSPSSSPSLASRALPTATAHRTIKRAKTNMSGRPLALPRLLETLGADDMRSLLTSICERHPDIGQEVVETAPRPSVNSALGVLHNYESVLQASFPFGNNQTSDYAYNRVRQNLISILDALRDYTPHFLPPNETQASTSLSYLDGATGIIHGLPNWDNYQHNRHKHDAYEEISKAWALAIREAAKRGGGIQLQYGGWDQKLSKHNELSGGKMEEAIQELRTSLGWMGGDAGPAQASAGPTEASSIRQQLLSGTYGTQVRVGPW